MSDSIKVLIASYSSSCLNKMEAALKSQSGIQLERLLVPEDQEMSLVSTSTSCDVLVIGLTDNWEKLIALSSNTPLVVTGSGDNAEMVRLSFKAGAADFIGDPVDSSELLVAIKHAKDDFRTKAPLNSGDVTAFVSPKGGAGASTLAVHLAHILSTRDYHPDVLLMDFDFQYGNLALHFDEKPNSRLTSALNSPDALDAAALDACVSRNEHNLHTLSSHSEQIYSPWDVDSAAIATMLSLCKSRYKHVMFDVPRTIDPVTYGALEVADKICIVVQQTLSDLRIAHEYVRLLNNQGIAMDRFSIVVNRFEKSNVIRLQDFESAFDGIEVHGVPNDYKRVSFTAEHSVSLVRKWRSAVITKNLVQFSNTYWPDQTEKGRWTFAQSKEAGKAA